MLLRIFFVLLCCILGNQSIIASVKYVSASGNDANPGTLLLPYQNIQYGLNQISSGDTLYIRSGNYAEPLQINNFGHPDSLTLISNYNNEPVVINGSDTTQTYMLLLQNVSGIAIQGLHFDTKYQQDAIGIYVLGEGRNIKITNCIVSQIGWTNNSTADPFLQNPNGQAHGILVNGRTAVGMRQIEISHCKLHSIISGNSEALTLVGNVDSFELAYDTVFNTKNIAIVAAGFYAWAINGGVDPNLNQARNGKIHHCVVYNNKRFSNLYAPAGIYADGAKHVQIFQNRCYNNGNGISIGCENLNGWAEDIHAFNNLIYNNDNKGIILGSNAALIKKCTVFNNTCFKNGKAELFNSEIALQYSDSCEIKNNILIPYQNSYYGISIFAYTATHLFVDHNLIYRYTNDQSDLYVQVPAAQFIPQNTINADPVFVDTNMASLNLYLSKTSPAINQGAALNFFENNRDLADSSRWVNGIVDLGAYERQDGACPQILNIDSNMHLGGKFIAELEIHVAPVLQLQIREPMYLFAPVVKAQSDFYIDKAVHISSQSCN